VKEYGIYFTFAAIKKGIMKKIIALTGFLALFAGCPAIKAQIKNILLEEMSTTLCSFCPYKSHDLMEYAKANPRAIAIIHHAGFGKDAMTSTAASDFAAAFSPNHFPSMTIDRIKFDSSGTYYTTKVGISMMAFPWEDTVTAHLSYVSPKAVVDIGHTYNNSNRTINGNVEVTFLSIPDSSDYRINLYIIEDSVVGDTGAYAYDQKNNKTNDPNYPELFGKTLIQDYVHKNVVRAAPLGSWGKDGVIPAIPASGTQYNTPFSYQIPIKYDTIRGREVDPSKIRLVAFVSTYHADTWKRQVLNSVMVNLGAASALPEGELSSELFLYPNPARDYAYLNFALERNENMQIELLDMTGKSLQFLHKGQLNAGQYSLLIKCGNLHEGTYMIRLNSDERNRVLRFIKL
jgi:hypothetical protein